MNFEHLPLLCRASCRSSSWHRGSTALGYTAGGDSLYTHKMTLKRALQHNGGQALDVSHYMEPCVKRMCQGEFQAPSTLPSDAAGMDLDLELADAPISGPPSSRSWQADQSQFTPQKFLGWSQLTSVAHGAAQSALAPGRQHRLPLGPTAISDGVCDLGADVGTDQRAPAMNDQMWQCIAELSALMEAYLASLPGCALKAYHSFTKQPKGQVWQHFCQAHGASHDDVIWRHIPMPLPLQLVRDTLQRAFSGYEHASIIQYTFEKQDWLQGWCAKWQYNNCRDIAVIAVHAYPAGQPGAMPAHKVYLPMFPGA